MRNVEPLLVVGAGKDDWVSPKYCVSARSWAEGAVYEVVVYHDVLQGLDIPMTEQRYLGHTHGENFERLQTVRHL